MCCVDQLLDSLTKAPGLPGSLMPQALGLGKSPASGLLLHMPHSHCSFLNATGPEASRVTAESETVRGAGRLQAQGS